VNVYFVRLYCTNLNACLDVSENLEKLLNSNVLSLVSIHTHVHVIPRLSLGYPELGDTVTFVHCAETAKNMAIECQQETVEIRMVLF